MPGEESVKRTEAYAREQLPARRARHRLRVARAIDRGEYRPDRTAILILTAALFLAGAASIAWLFAS